MTREEYIDFANALKNNYTIDFDKLPEFCDMAISALSDKWIPVSERLPEKEKERYLIDYMYEDEEHITVSFYDKYGFWSSPEVRAWQPLPEPYKENEA